MMNNQQSHSWGNNRPFNAYSNYLKQKFGGRIQKISLNGGFTCPNRDGTVGVGGCAFCNNDAFITSYCVASNGITQQIIDGKLFVKRRYRRANTYFAYFQAYSNTYTSLENLKKLFNEVKEEVQNIDTEELKEKTSNLIEEFKVKSKDIIKELDEIKKKSPEYISDISKKIEDLYNEKKDLIDSYKKEIPNFVSEWKEMLLAYFEEIKKEIKK